MKTLVSVAVLLVMSFQSVAQDLDMEVVGLFKNVAVLNISGNERLLKVGQLSPEGVLLVSADSKEAVIEISGKKIHMTLSSRIGAEFKTPASVTVSIMLNGAGQYRTTGSINGRPVSFLVDTGATIVAINSITAKSLGIDSSRGRVLRATTASGVVESAEVFLDIVKVGGIKIRNVQAAVIPGSFPLDILLGMSFLRNVEIRENAGTMQLTTKY